MIPVTGLDDEDQRNTYFYGMCGIAGIISASPIGDPPLRERLVQMSEALQHRGPDGEGLHVQEAESLAVGLCHRRLAITDVSSRAAQPMYCLDRYLIVHNGEIYNHRELRAKLETRGYSFQTDADTEVIVAAYDADGKDCLESFEGMFAFAIWDQLTSTLWCARDRFGEKPFYFHVNAAGDCVYFASEMKALWAAGIARWPKKPFFLHFLSSGITSHPAFPELTFYEEILQLPPAHHLSFCPLDRTLSMERYWDLDKETSIQLNDDEAIRSTREKLEHAIALCLHDEIRQGIALSGGVDSSILAVVGTGQLGDKGRLPSFSAVFPGFEKDESESIRMMAATSGTEMHLIAPDADMLLEKLQLLAYHQEEPFTSAGILAQFAVHGLARQHGMKLLLDGQGADEVFGGYTRYAHWYLQEKIAGGEFSLTASEARLLATNRFLPEWGWRHYAAAWLPGLASARLEARARRQQQGNRELDPKFLEEYGGAGFIQKPVVRKLNDILYHDACQGPLQELLRYADRNAMAHGIELRLPYLHHRLAEHIFSLPSAYKFKNGYPKWILRNAYQKSLGDAIAWRKGKTGFEPPQKSWMQHPKVSEEIRNAHIKLVELGMLSPAVLKRDIKPCGAYDADNRDWRYWMASLFL